MDQAVPVTVSRVETPSPRHVVVVHEMRVTIPLSAAEPSEPVLQSPPASVPMRTGVVHVEVPRVVDQPSRRIATQYVVVGQSRDVHPDEGEPAGRHVPSRNSTTPP